MKNILYLVENESFIQFRYRVKNIITACEKSQDYHVDFLKTSDVKKIKSTLPNTNLLIFARQTSKNSLIPDLITLAKKQGIKVIFDLDDLIFDYRDLPLLMRSTNSKNIFYWTGYFWGIRRIARRADGFLATNDFLAQKLKRTFKKPVAVIPNSLNAEQISASEKYLKSQKPHNGFILGYFSGSPTHAKDFHLIEPAVIKFLETHLDAKLSVVGYMEFSPRAKALLDAGRITFQKPVDYLKLQALMADVDVNLAPLVENNFTNCKSELKFFESAIVETPTIASPTYAFKHAIKDGETGLLAGPDAWLKKLEFLYNNPDKARQIAIAAKDYCLKTYSGKALLTQIEKAYHALLQ